MARSSRNQYAGAPADPPLERLRASGMHTFSVEDDAGRCARLGALKKGRAAPTTSPDSLTSSAQAWLSYALGVSMSSISDLGV